FRNFGGPDRQKRRASSWELSLLLVCRDPFSARFINAACAPEDPHVGALRGCARAGGQSTPPEVGPGPCVPAGAMWGYNVAGRDSGDGNAREQDAAR
ncbi:unnamed protein product, partial [Amoebophrya sp. A120]